MTLTDAQLDEIEARANAATPGPWTVKDETADEFWFGNGYLDILPYGIPIGGHDRFGKPQPEQQANADFIAHARADVPALIAALRESREREKRYEVALGRISDGVIGNNHGEHCQLYRRIASAALGEQGAT